MSRGPVASLWGSLDIYPTPQPRAGRVLGLMLAMGHSSAARDPQPGCWAQAGCLQPLHRCFTPCSTRKARWVCPRAAPVHQQTPPQMQHKGSSLERASLCSVLLFCGLMPFLKDLLGAQQESISQRSTGGVRWRGTVRHSNGVGRGVNQLSQSQPQAVHYVFRTQKSQASIAQLHGLPQLKIPAGLGGMGWDGGAKAESCWAGGAAGPPQQPQDPSPPGSHCSMVRDSPKLP